MTDSEIVKALECCSTAITADDCERLGCPCFADPQTCIFSDNRTIQGVIDGALDLINRQKAEIERLTETMNATIAGQETLQRYIATADRSAQWIRADERLPEDESGYNQASFLVIVSGKVGNLTLENAIELAYYSKSDGWILEMWPMAKDPKISHWMPLPALPGDVLTEGGV